MKSQKGFSVIPILILTIILAMAGGVGYWVYSNNSKSSLTNSNTSAQSIPATQKSATESIDDITSGEGSEESSINSKYDSESQSTAQSTDSAASSIGGSVDESSL